MKRELKNKQKEEERKIKADEKAKQAAARPSAKVADDDDLDPTQYFENRLKVLAAEKSVGLDPYSHKFQVSMSLPEYIEKYKDLGEGVHLEDVEVSVAGRIMNTISSFSKLFFYDLHGTGAKVQVMADARRSSLNESEFLKLHSGVKRGDIGGLIGFPDSW